MKKIHMTKACGGGARFFWNVLGRLKLWWHLFSFLFSLLFSLSPSNYLAKGHFWQSTSTMVAPLIPPWCPRADSHCPIYLPSPETLPSSSLTHHSRQTPSASTRAPLNCPCPGEPALSTRMPITVAARPTASHARGLPHPPVNLKQSWQATLPNGPGASPTHQHTHSSHNQALQRTTLGNSPAHQTVCIIYKPTT